MAGICRWLKHAGDGSDSSAEDTVLGDPEAPVCQPEFYLPNDVAEHTEDHGTPGRPTGRHRIDT
jgi:hypothetical protein